MKKRHISEFQSSEFHNGRAAGTGIIEDDYSEEAFPDKHPYRYKSKEIYIERTKDLNGPVIIIREATKC